MIEPNFNLLLWIMLVTYTIGAFANIIAGILKLEKSKNYGVSDFVFGILELVLLVWVATS